MRIRLPRRTMRFRLAALFSALFLAVGALLLAITDVLLANGTPVTGDRAGKDGPGATHAQDLHDLLAWSGVALGLMTVLAIGLGWFTAGRVLRPLLSNEAALESQRRFVASAAHELRTPLTFNRALLEVALADPSASLDDLRATCRELLAAGEQQERLVEALLALATSEQGLKRREPFDLAKVTWLALAAHKTEAEHRSLRLNVSLDHAAVQGDPDLAERMAANLIDNAIRYNVPGGRVEVHTETRDDRALLTVANTGSPVPADKVDQLFHPFRRLPADRASHPDGHGLGLSIVRAIATAHGACLDTRPGPAGGLTVAVRFPPARDR